MTCNDTDPNTTIEWVGRDGSNSGQCFIERIGGFFSAGLAHIGMELGYFIYQDTGLPWQASTRYTLTVGIGNRNDAFTQNGNVSVIGLTDTVPAGTNTAEILANDPFLAGASDVLDANIQPDSTFQDLTVTFDTGRRRPSGHYCRLPWRQFSYRTLPLRQYPARCHHSARPRRRRPAERLGAGEHAES